MGFITPENFSEGYSQMKRRFLHDEEEKSVLFNNMQNEHVPKCFPQKEYVE